MEINVVAKEKTFVEFEISGTDNHTIPELIVGKLSVAPGVEFVAYKVEHPLVGVARVVLRTKSKDAVAVALEAVSGIKDEFTELKTALKAASK
jgi:DNA-directed RNA polymerase subunit L